MRIHSILKSVAIVSVLGVIASCGGSDSSSTSGGEISKADFVERANAFCTSLSEKLANAQADLGSSPTEEQISGFMTDALVAEYRLTIGDIRNLGFPAGDESLLDGILSDAEKVLDEINSDPVAVLSAAETPFADVNAGFQDYGLTVCAET
ncbi:MAG: hypothetical protein ABIQ38_00760 [Ilumatobacteraceae bacterium]